MSRIAFTGFETGELLEFPNAYAGGVTIVTTQKHSGDFSLKIVPTNTLEAWLSLYPYDNFGIRGAIPLDLTVNVRFYVRVAALGTSDAITLIYLRDDILGLPYFLYLGTDGKLEGRRNENTAYTPKGTTVLAANTWYCIQIAFVGGAEGRVRVWVDGVLDSDSGSVQMGSTESIFTVRFGRETTTTDASHTVYFDDITIDDAVMPGPGTVIRLDPVGAGYSDWTGLSTGTYADIDDWGGAVANDGATTMATGAGGGTTQMRAFTVEAPATASAIGLPKMVSVHVMARKNVLGTYPTVSASGSGNSGANATQHTITLPTHAAGDSLLVFFCNDGSATVSGGAGAAFSKQDDKQTGTAARLTTWKFTATAAGHTLRLDTSASEASAYVAYVISAGSYDPSATGFAKGTAASGTSANPNPPVCSPSWSSDKKLWIGAYGWDGNVAHTSYPTELTANQLTSRWANTQGCGIACATLEGTETTKDPGTATIGSDDWATNTFAVRTDQVSTATSIHVGIRSGGTNNLILTTNMTATAFTDTNAMLGHELAHRPAGGSWSYEDLKSAEILIEKTTAAQRLIEVTAACLQVELEEIPPIPYQPSSVGQRMRMRR